MLHHKDVNAAIAASTLDRMRERERKKIWQRGEQERPHKQQWKEVESE